MFANESIKVGVEFEITYCKDLGQRYDMEDKLEIVCEETDRGEGYHFIACGVFDGHGGKEAARFAKHNLIRNILCQGRFWKDNDADVRMGIRLGFLKTHQDMWSYLEERNKMACGTTATLVFLMRSKMYIAHVGDSCVVLGHGGHRACSKWKAELVTSKHDLHNNSERRRVLQSGGKIAVGRSGVERVVAIRPPPGHQGPITRSTRMTEKPLLALTRALGNHWSLNLQSNSYIVSPEPEIIVRPINISDRCVILASDGIWDVMSPQESIDSVHEVEVRRKLNPESKYYHNHSIALVQRALEEWEENEFLADNISVITIILNKSESS